jgi:hypothetical protein
VSWYQHFDKELTNAFAKNEYVLITGDINIDYLKPLPSNWETILSTYGLGQLVHNPTRVTGSKSVTLIYHIYVSRPEEVMQVRVSTYCPGDHYPVSCSVKYGKSNKSKPRVNKHTVIRYRN